MNGSRVLLDTNAIASLLQGNLTLVELLKSAEWIGISVISEIEFLANPALNEEDKTLFENFISRIDVIDLYHLDTVLISLILEIRKKSKVKLPDAIIAATAIHNKAKIITSDEGFRRVARLKVIEI